MTTTTQALPPPVQQKFDMKLLARPMQKNIHSYFGMKKVMEEHVGDILRMRRYSNLAQFPVPLGPNFLNPPTQVLSATDIDAQVQYYATSVLITKQVKERVACSKSALIDLESYGESYADRAQAA